MRVRSFCAHDDGMSFAWTPFFFRPCSTLARKKEDTPHRWHTLPCVTREMPTEAQCFGYLAAGATEAVGFAIGLGLAKYEE